MTSKPRIQELLDACRQGDESAFLQIYDMYAGRLMGYAHALLEDPEAAEDVVQETFAAFANALPTLEIRGSFGSYIFGVTRNQATDVIRRRSSRGRVKSEYEIFTAWKTVADSADPHRVVEQEELRKRLDACVQELPEPEREVLMLKTLGDLKFREIASLLDLPQGTVATRYRAALDKLRQKVANDERP